MMSKRGSGSSSSSSTSRPGASPSLRAEEGSRLLSPTLGAALTHALVTHMLAMDSTLLSDHLLLCAKVFMLYIGITYFFTHVFIGESEVIFINFQTKTLNIVLNK